MGQNDIIYDTQGNAFFQADPTLPFSWLTCTGVGDIAIPHGDSTAVYRPDPQRSGKMQVWDTLEGPPGLVTTRLTKPLNNVYNFLLEQKCRFQFRINWVCAGERVTVGSYKIAKILIGSRMRTSGITAPVKGAGTDAAGKQVDTTADLDGLGATLVYPLKSSHLTLASTTDVNGIVFVPEQCASACRDAIGLGQIGYALVEATLYSGIQKTADYGATWAATTDQPFTIAGNDASSGLIAETSSGYRLIIAGSVADPLMPAEVSYMDITAPTNPTDLNGTWVNVYVGTVVNLGINMIRRNWAGRIWAAMTGGYLAYSDTLGASWTTINTGAAQDFNDLVFLDDRQGFVVGNSNTFYYTNDGLTWSAGTGPAVGVNLLSIDANRFGYLFVTTNDARVFRSVDDGQTWVEIIDLASGSIKRIRFDPEFLYIGAFLYNNATPVGHFYRTEDGGASWTEWAMPTTPVNAGLNDVFVCDPNLYYVGGNAVAALSYVAKFERQAS